MSRSHTALLLLAWLLALPSSAQDSGKVECEISENGGTATGTVTVLAGEREVARSACGKTLTVPPGSYTAVLSLDGALDGPEQRKPLTVETDKVAKLKGEFATGKLEVRIKSQGKDTAGMAVIRRDGRQIGTLGSGVAAHLSTGKYEVVARYRAQQKAFSDVTIEQGRHTVLEAAFE
jgi:hypothetical protein